MKRTIYFIVCFFFYTTGIVLAGNQIPLTPPHSNEGPSRTRDIDGTTITTVTAEINENNLTVYFPTAVGIATIAIANQLGEIVAIETIDTSINSEMTISTVNLDAGSYTLTIEYDTTLLTGSFTL